MGFVHPSGYGMFRFGTGMRMAHRVAYALFKGELQPGLVIMHTCDNRICVNPGHLLQGTRKENNNDCVRKGRWRGCIVIPDSTVRAIREVYCQLRNYSQVARQFGVTPDCARKLVLRLSRKNVL